MCVDNAERLCWQLSKRASMLVIWNKKKKGGRKRRPRECVIATTPRGLQWSVCLTSKSETLFHKIVSSIFCPLQTRALVISYKKLFATSIFWKLLFILNRNYINTDICTKIFLLIVSLIRSKMLWWIWGSAKLHFAYNFAIIYHQSW